MLPKSLNILLRCFAEFCRSSQFVCAGIGFTVYMINLADVSKLCVHENGINSFSRILLDYHEEAFENGT